MPNKNEHISPETFLEYCIRESIENARNEKFHRLRQREERFLPQPNVIVCAECSNEFVRYLRATDYQTCTDHIINHQD